MKLINIIITSLILIASTAVFGGKTLSLKLESRWTKSSTDSVNAFMKELSPILDRPLSWCKVEPTGFDLQKIGKKTSDLIIQVSAVCEDGMAKELFRNVIFRHRKFLDNYGDLVDSAFAKQYPHLTIHWGVHREKYRAWVELSEGYGKGLGHSNKHMLFKMVLNDKFTSTKIGKISLHGTIINTTRGKSFQDETVKFFKYTVYNKTLKSDNPTVKLERVYRPKKNETYVLPY